MSRDAAVEKPSLVLVSHTGVPLSRSTTFRFTLDPNREQDQALRGHAGAARLAYNHHLGRVKANLGQRAAERSYGVAETDLTPPFLGVKTLAVVADQHGRVLHTWAGVKALQHAQARLKLANQS